jgi:ribosomal protein L40E
MYDNDKKLLSNIIDYLNKIEERIKTLEINLSEMKDLELVNKLDIINLKNEIEQIKLIKGISTSGHSVEEIMSYMKNLENRLQKIESTAPTETKKLNICTKCGSVLPEKAKFCPNCGEKIQ